MIMLLMKKLEKLRSLSGSISRSTVRKTVRSSSSSSDSVSLGVFSLLVGASLGQFAIRKIQSAFTTKMARTKAESEKSMAPIKRVVCDDDDDDDDAGNRGSGRGDGGGGREDLEIEEEDGRNDDDEEDDENGGGSGDKDDDDDRNDAGDKEDEEDDSTILKLVRERMNLFANALCCSGDKGEVFDPGKQRWYADYYRHVENPNAKKMFVELAKEGKRTKKTRSQLGEECVEQGQGSHHPLDEQGSREDGGSPGDVQSGS